MAQPAFARNRWITSMQGEAARHGVTLELVPDVRAGTVQLVWIERGSEAGSGATVLRQLCEESDRAGIRLDLCVLQGEPKLITYYQRFGFRVAFAGSEDAEPVMVRKPARAARRSAARKAA